MKQIVILWIAVGLVITSLLVPPFGYTEFVVHTVSKGEVTKVPNIVPWTYVEHRFILREPPTGDKKLSHYFSKSEGFLSFASVENMGIAWPILTVQIVIIILLALGASLTVRVLGRSKQ
jgi:lipoprotein signal peptidase